MHRQHIPRGVPSRSLFHPTTFSLSLSLFLSCSILESSPPPQCSPGSPRGEGWATSIAIFPDSAPSLHRLCTDSAPWAFFSFFSLGTDNITGLKSFPPVRIIAVPAQGESERIIRRYLGRHTHREPRG